MFMTTDAVVDLAQLYHREYLELHTQVTEHAQILIMSVLSTAHWMVT